MCKCFLKTEKTLLNPKGGCMKKLLVLALVLSVATIANAGLVISGAPTVALNPITNPTATLSIVGDGAGMPTAFDAYLVIQGPGTVAGGTLVYTYGLSAYGLYTNDDTYVPWMQGVFSDNTIQQVADITFADTAVPMNAITGNILTDLAFTCTGRGDVTLSLVTMNGDGTAVDTTWSSVVIHQTPEPFTMGLLGLGGLFLRRRK
jgi:hypothetical protein